MERSAMREQPCSEHVLSRISLCSIRATPVGTAAERNACTRRQVYEDFLAKLQLLGFRAADLERDFVAARLVKERVAKIMPRSHARADDVLARGLHQHCVLGAKPEHDRS